jgi:hypothetical protein
MKPVAFIAPPLSPVRRALIGNVSVSSSSSVEFVEYEFSNDDDETAPTSALWELVHASLVQRERLHKELMEWHARQFELPVDFLEYLQAVRAAASVGNVA